MEDIRRQALQQHYEWQGKIEVVPRVPLTNRQELSLAYTPGVAEPCLAIAEDYNKSFALTRRSHMVAVITDGSAVLGLGNIGPAAAMPVMEGKCALFKAFAGVDAFPLCIDTQDTDELVRTIALLSKSFGGVNLEDISAPRCFEIEERLQAICDIPIFHDDQHGTAIVAAAAVMNACKVTERDASGVRIVINGAGAAGIAIAKQLLAMGLGEITLCDINGIVCAGDESLNPAQQQIALQTNLQRQTGKLADALRGADIFIGVSRPNLVTGEMVATMAAAPILFPMANPTPEILPQEALAAGAAVVGTGRSDYPNQINNLLAFPGIFKGALAAGAKAITQEMKIAAAHAIASLVSLEELSPGCILPSPFHPGVADAVAQAVMACVQN